jgi:hypothetical protein
MNAPVNTPPFSWSYSKLKNFETCARRYHEVDVKKAWPQPKTPELERGDALHLAMKKRVADNVELPAEFTYMEPWATRLTHNKDQAHIMCELKWALNIKLVPTGWFAKDAWVRGVIDYIQYYPSPIPSTELAMIVDYKTGKPKEDDTQLGLNACLAFAHSPQLVGINAVYLWTEYNDTTHMTFSRKNAREIWSNVKPRVARLEAATIANNFPATKNRLCREHCPVLSCEHNGKR